MSDILLSVLPAFLSVPALKERCKLLECQLNASLRENRNLRDQVAIAIPRYLELEDENEILKTQKADLQKKCDGQNTEHELTTERLERAAIQAEKKPRQLSDQATLETARSDRDAKKGWEFAVCGFRFRLIVEPAASAKSAKT